MSMGFRKNNHMGYRYNCEMHLHVWEDTFCMPHALEMPRVLKYI